MEDKYKPIRPNATRVRDKCGKQVGDKCNSRGPSLQDQTWCQILGPKLGPAAEFKNWN